MQNFNLTTEARQWNQSLNDINELLKNVANLICSYIKKAPCIQLLQLPIGKPIQGNCQMHRK